ncbi:peptidylprolyl isomerase [Thioclava sp. A2]|uniref:peptidylprolyl isomerase n=1 Tax=Thioclava sp. FCG-A2 TaxID=3080562 RepID=UPI002953FE70|nr:peptidylprolyl isomerase [Thioclava sp. A2]MDV7269836.1 peptidylprolyl isomerase [Thioclava sp. A2]
MMRFPSLLASLLALTLGTGQPALAQSSQFAPQITVNGQGITGFEISQRMELMRVLRAPGDLREVAENGLIEDRLRLDIAKRMGISLNTDAINEGMGEFAARANMKTEDLLKALAQEGIEPQTFRDFVSAGLLWRAVVREKFRGQINISEADVDRAMMPESELGKGTQVLLSEIIIPAPVGQEADAMALARRASAMTDPGAFAAMARDVSASQSKGRGGRLDWMPLENLPPALRPAILSLAPNQATQPMPLPNAVAVFMLRDINDGAKVKDAPQMLDYAALVLGPAGSETVAKEAVRIADRADRCKDLYGVAKDYPAEQLEMISAPQSEIAQDIAVQLASMDVNESRLMNRAGTETLVMLCNRQTILGEGAEAPSRDAVRERLLNQRLTGFADRFYTDQFEAAVITRQ